MTFYETITAAIKDIEDHGFDSMQRIRTWMELIRKSAFAQLIPESKLNEALGAMFQTQYRRLIDSGQVFKIHKGVSRFGIDQVKPKLRAELERRKAASADLIKNNREEMVAKTERRFAGWATSIPDGGSDAVKKKEVKDDLRKAMQSLPFEERRVMIDQGHKFISNLNDIIAIDNNALIATWHSKWRQPGYRYREDHKERDRRVFVIRDNWAIKAGLMKVGPDGYTDQITKPGEEVYCGCSYQYGYNLRDVPESLLTEKGKRALESVRING